ncbi:efflux RND transporter periplasmic adaptor subunit [bacterium]|nr:MAG: efflux RND transporter periplasmic adaptor subunit [bacterium]
MTQSKSKFPIVPFIVGGILIVGGLGFIAWHRSSSSAATAAASADEAPTPAPAPVKVVRARLAPVETLVDAQGAFVASQGGSARIAPASAGRLSQVFVREGERVQIGQLLALVDSRSAQAAVRSAQAALGAAGADTQSASLGTQVAQSDAQNATAQAQTGLKSAQADRDTSVQSARAALTQALSDTRKASLAANTSDLSNAITQARLGVTVARTDAQSSVQAAQNALAQAQTDYDKTRAGARPQEIAAAQAALESAQATQSRAQIEVTRSQRLYDKGLFARRQLDDAQTALQVATQSTESARAALDLLRAGAVAQDVEAARLRVTAAQNTLSAAKQSGDAKVAQAQAQLSLAQSALRQTAPQRGEDIRASSSRVQAAREALDSAIKSGDAKVAQAQATLRAAQSGALTVASKRADERSKLEAQNAKVADLQSAQVAVSQTEVRSPLNGTVVKRLLNTGENADVTTPVVEIASSSALDFVAQLLPFDAARVAPGQMARVILDGGPTLDARVESIGTVDATTGLQSVRLSVAGTANATSGVVAKVQIVVERRLASVTIPPTALLSRGGKTVVLVAQGGVAHEVEVTVGTKTNAFVEVRKGLKPGDVVITQGGYELEDGAEVQLTQTTK